MMHIEIHYLIYKRSIVLMMFETHNSHSNIDHKLHRRKAKYYLPLNLTVKNKATICILDGWWIAW